jgi:hypothetical protein
MRERAHARFLERQDLLQARAADAVLSGHQAEWKRGEVEGGAAERVLALMLDERGRQSAGGTSALEAMLQNRMAAKMEEGIDAMFDGGSAAGVSAAVEKFAPILGPILMAKFGGMDPAQVAQIVQSMNPPPAPGG